MSELEEDMKKLNKHYLMKMGMCLKGGGHPIISLDVTKKRKGLKWL